MVGGHRNGQRLPEQASDMERGPGHGKLGQDQVLAAIVELAHQVARRGLADVEAQVGVGSVQIAHHIRHQVRAERGRGAHPDRSGEARFQGDRQIEDALRRIQHLASPARDLAACHRQAHGPAAALHQRLIQRILERLDLHRQGWLRYAATFRRLAEVVRIFERHEISKLAQGERWDRVRHVAPQIVVGFQ
jgi:hypothetical protein